ncbi:toll/interleukin-1 receptor domain-containing protein [Facklamia sp. P13064]|uniref:toll/interleukin-1 receptor domain-containing protein n=1 Tax=unclassified Facklamia TaxID=2622293 RepID=UPI003D184AF6
MSVKQYQSQLNNLDKDIAILEKKRAEEDRKAALKESKALKVTISKSASQATVNSKLRQISQYQEIATKARAKSANYSKKIGEKRKKRNEVYQKLQKAEQDLKKKETKETQKIQRMYEDRIKELEGVAISKVESINKTLSSERAYDVFISHAYEDKESFVNELVDELMKKGVSVWYDNKDTVWGSSLREEIDSGLKHSKYGIVVLSPSYIADGKYWTKQELNGLFQMESIESGRILPIWHQLTKKEVANYSPMIADRKAMTTAILTPGEIAEEFAKLLKIVSEGEK